MQFGPGESYALGCAFAWAVAVILLRKAGESLAPLPLNLFKIVFGLGLFIPTLLIVEGPAWPDLPPAAVALALLSGLLGIGLADTLYFRALNAIGASRMAVAQTLYSPSVILLSVAFLGERLGIGQVAGVVLVLAGVVLVTRPETGTPAGRDLLSGMLLGGASVFVMATAVVIAKPLLEQYAFLWVLTLRMIGGLIGMAVYLAWRREGRAFWRAYRGVRHWPHIVASTVTGSYLSMMLWLAGYKYTQASIAAVLNEMAAVFILLLAFVFLGDRLRMIQWLGSMLAVAGVALVVG